MFKPSDQLRLLASGKVTTSVSEATAKDVDTAVDAAQKAFDTVWGLNASGSQRSILLGKLSKLLEDNADELAALEALDNGASLHICVGTGSVLNQGSVAGKTYNWARNADVAGAIDCIRYYAGWADKISGQVQEV